MKNIALVFSSCLVMASSALYGQKKPLQPESDTFKKYALSNTQSFYRSLLRKNHDSAAVISAIGDTFFNAGNMEKAGVWYAKLYDLEKQNVSPNYLFRYALCLKNQENYALADTYMKKFAEAKPTEIRAELINRQDDYMKDIQKNNDKFSVKRSTVNSAFSDISPSFYKEGLVFSSARYDGSSKKSIQKKDDQNYHKLYYVDKNPSKGFSQALKFFKKTTLHFNEASSAFTKDGKTIYFTSNNVVSKKAMRDNKGFSRLNLYKATLRNGEWVDIKALPFNNLNYSVAHPALSSDEKTLYFSSDMPGTFGESDIFKVAINDDGSYGEPVNLGPTVNTEGRETYPFVSNNNLLYFASNGHPGLGGLDVFVTRLDNYCVFNLGSPMNSPSDDFAFIIDEKSKTGFVASNRQGGKGSDDLYAFEQRSDIDFTCLQDLVQTITEKTSNTPVANAEIKVYDENNNLVATGTTDENGVSSLSANYTSEHYKMIVSKEGFEMLEHRFYMEKEKPTKDIPLTLEMLKEQLLNKDKLASVGTNLLKYLDLEPIHFKLNSSSIDNAAKPSLDAIASYLKRFEDLKIEIASHTDSSGRNTYNQILSEKRAQKTLQYLSSKGVANTRLTAKGYGETQLLNNCKDWKKCSDKENEKNRRSEFIVIK